MTAPPSKVMSLRDAVATLVEPGMDLHLGYGGGRPNAAVAELVRQFSGRDPRFTVSAHGFVNTQHALIGAGLVERLIVAYAGENYPAPRPNPALQRAVRSGEVTVESWSLWTLTARLMAGALGVPFFPVRSLVGSGMADEHVGRDFDIVSGPGGDEHTGAVRALRPDLVLVQGLAADPTGNVILAPPYGEAAWGALAARRGVLACVERIVDSDYISEHNQLPMIPAHAVRAVCHVPFGSHPYGMYPVGLPGVDGYVEDDAFMAGLRSAAKSPEGFAEWISTWITGTADHDEFLALLGEPRLAALRQQADSGPASTGGTGGTGADDDAASAGRTGPATVDERMTLAAARVLRDRVTAAGHDTVLSGIGYAHLAAWTAVLRLQTAGVPVELAAELGMAGFRPRPGDPYLFAGQNLPTCLQLADVLSVLGRDVSGPGTSSIGVLGAGQIDAAGNINSTWSDSGDYIVGSGGANDVATAANDVIAVVTHAPSRLVEKVGYITAPGTNVSVIVTSKAVLERRDGRYVVTQWLGDLDRDEAVAEVTAATGWPVDIAPDVRREPDPDPEDLRLLRAFDPAGVFLRA